MFKSVGCLIYYPQCKLCMRSLGGQLTHFFVDLQLFWITFWARKVSFSAGESKEKIPCIAVRWICIVMTFDFLFTNISCAQTGSTYLVSTHVVCEILSAMHYHIAVTRIFGSKFLECPHSSISGMWVWSTPGPHPDENENLAKRTYVGAGVWRQIAKDTVFFIM